MVSSAYFEAFPEKRTSMTDVYLANGKADTKDEGFLRGIGGVAIDASITPDELLQEIGLDWEPMLSDIRYGEIYQRSDTGNDRVMFRPQDGAYMGIVGKDFIPKNPDNNRSGFQMLADTFMKFCQDSGARPTYAGVIQKMDTKLSVEMWMACNLNGAEGFTLPGGDVNNTNLLMRCPFKYGSGYKFSLFQEALVCTNGMTVNVKSGQKIIPHSRLFNEDLCLKILSGAKTSWALLEESATLMAETPISEEMAVLKLIESFGTPGQPLHEQPDVVQAAIAKFNNHTMIGGSMLSRYNTAWGLLQSVTEYYNHDYGKFRSVETRAESLLQTGKGSTAANQKQLAFMQSISGFAYGQRHGENAAQQFSRQIQSVLIG